MSVTHLLVLLLLVTFGALVGSSIARWRKKRALASLRERGQQGEINAERWLREAGFDIIESQRNEEFFFLADGQRRTFRVRPDIMATFRGQSWLIEVKTGKSASPDYPATRRQIREYAQLWPRHRYALFDATQGLFYEISFKGVQHLSLTWLLSQFIRPISLVMLTVGVMTGVVIGYLRWGL